MANNTNIGQALLNVPFSEMVTSLATAIARSQTALDLESIEILKLMGNKEAAPVSLPYMQLEKGELKDVDMVTSMIGAGFQPTFYQFAETIIEVRMAITAVTETESQEKTSGTKTTTTTTSSYYSRRNIFSRYTRAGRRVTVTSTPIDATYSNKYNFTQEGSSLLRTRLVPVPPNSIIQQQLDLRSQAMQLDFELKLKEYELAIAQKQQELDEKLSKLEENAESQK